MFQLWTHAVLYEQTGDPSRPYHYKEPDSAAENGAAHHTEAETAPHLTEAETAPEEETPMLSLSMTVALLAVVTVVCTQVVSNVADLFFRWWLSQQSGL